MSKSTIILSTSLWLRAQIISLLISETGIQVCFNFKNLSEINFNWKVYLNSLQRNYLVIRCLHSWTNVKTSWKTSLNISLIISQSKNLLKWFLISQAKQLTDRVRSKSKNFNHILWIHSNICLKKWEFSKKTSKNNWIPTIR